MEYLSVFSPKAGKYGPEETPYLDTFHAVIIPRLELNKESLNTSVPWMLK